MAKEKKVYSKLGVSAEKEEVHDAIKDKDQGLFPGAFCKIVEDVNGRPDYCSIFHADGAGTKSSLAYMYYKETNDLSILKGVVRDAVIMNVDDVLCVGATGNMFLSNNLGRNSSYIPGDVVGTIINEYYDYSIFLKSLGLNIVMCGGETADVGDLVKTLILDASLFTTMKRNEVINASNIRNGDVIVGLASYGKASYEDEYNSGIASNGLTLARHGTLSHQYFKKYPECYNQNLDEKLIFWGKYKLTDNIQKLNTNIGKLLLSPTRTFAPILLKILKKYRKEITGIVHNTGGGQTKDLHYGNGIKYVKNNLFPLPLIFEIIQNSSKTEWKEMYVVFNMGHRMELFCHESIAKDLIKIAKAFNVGARIIGHCEKSDFKNKNSVEIKSEFGNFIYP